MGAGAAIGCGFNKSDACMSRGGQLSISKIPRQDLTLRLGIVFYSRQKKGDSVNEKGSDPPLPQL